MEFNPYAVRVTGLAASIAEAEAKIEDCRQNLGWFSSFDVEKANADANGLSRKVASLEGEWRHLIKEGEKLSNRIQVLRDEAGFNLRDFFSGARAEKRHHLNAKEKELTQLENLQRELKSSLAREHAVLESLQVSLRKYRSFDPLEAEATAAILPLQVQKLKLELETIQTLKDRLDEQLREPLAEFMKLSRQKVDLKQQISLAEELNQKLNSAANKYERAKIHEDSERRLGDDIPSRVRSKARNELVPVDRDIGKLEKRLQGIGERALRVVKSIVIDGNNLCYEGQKFIGLSALVPVANATAATYDVVVVFDSDIRGLLKMRDRDISNQFSAELKVHVVASKSKADETVLDAARDADTFVISNDRFADYPEKPAVRDGRLLRHEILNGKACVYDLDVSVEFLVATSYL